MISPSTSKVLLVQMPWANATMPSAALGLLQAVLVREGLPCDTLYANLDSIEYLGGWETYDRLAVEIASELVFAPIYYERDREIGARHLAEEFAQSSVNPTADNEFYRQLISRAEAFLASLYARVPWEQYDIIGFSLTFQQTMSSLCLARMIKREFPNKQIVFGGASCDGSAGLEMVRAFPEIDYAVIGEADSVVAEVIRSVRRRVAEPSWPPTALGVVYQDECGAVRYTGTLPPTANMDALPQPSYANYFEALEGLGAVPFRPRVAIEQSRGCWYGQKQTCRFCGLSELSFRRKSPERAVREILTLSDEHGVCDFYVTDNILDHEYYGTVLPEVARLRHEVGYDLTFFYEVKSNLRRQQIETMAAAGIVMVQVGIESFHDGILERMAKGVNSIQQLQTLKHLEEHDIRAVWNILYANPFERPEEYREMRELIPFLHHLPPPHSGQVCRMELQRFSPYWRDPEKWGIQNIRPLPIYEKIYDAEAVALMDLVCFFEYDHADRQDQELVPARAEFIRAVDEWRELYRPGSLVYSRGPGFVRIKDSRLSIERGKPEATVVELRGLQAEIFEYCDSAKGVGQIAKEFEDRVSEQRALDFLDLLVERRLVYRSPKDKFLALPLRVRDPR